MTARNFRGPFAALVSMPAALALSACIPEFLGNPFAGWPFTLGPDSAYVDVTVHENPDGSTTFGTFHCDGRGKYLGGGDPSSEKRFDDALRSQLESAKNEIKRIDDDLQRCGGKKKLQYEYDAQAGCNREKLYADRDRAEYLNQQIHKHQETMENTRWYAQDMGKRASDLLGKIEDARRAGTSPSETELSSLDFHTGTLSAARAKVAAEQQRIEELKAERTELERSPNRQRCDAADAAPKSDPCSEANFNRNDNRRSSLRKEAAVHQYNKDRFDKCTDDRKRQAKASQDRGRTTIDPSIILNQPGLFRPSPRPSRPAPSQPSHPHKE